MQWQTLIKFHIKKWSQQFHVIVCERAIVGNHIHLLVRFPSRENYNNFVRALTGALAHKTKLKWLVRPFTRIVQKGCDFNMVTKYIIKNQLEGWGIIAHDRRSK